MRAAWNDGKADGPPVNWVKIHRVPDYTYFNHAVHVNRGVSCYSCHGDVNNMKVVYQHEPQSMSWCLDCHRAPENHLRPPVRGLQFELESRLQSRTARAGLKFKKSGTSTRPPPAEAATDETRF